MQRLTWLVTKECAIRPVENKNKQEGIMADKQLEIAFFGSSLVSAYWNGAATYYRGLCRSPRQVEEILYNFLEA